MPHSRRSCPPCLAALCCPPPHAPRPPLRHLCCRTQSRSHPVLTFAELPVETCRSHLPGRRRTPPAHPAPRRPRGVEESPPPYRSQAPSSPHPQAHEVPELPAPPELSRPAMRAAPETAHAACPAAAAPQTRAEAARPPPRLRVSPPAGPPSRPPSCAASRRTLAALWAAGARRRCTARGPVAHPHQWAPERQESSSCCWHSRGLRISGYLPLLWCPRAGLLAPASPRAWLYSRSF
mmetsp:Transcript_16960/g.37725  ORF Transcript_16960/g.37725 Transcript_16960/m.37725 type:complete len:236 (-) Transcript_16960:1219-1926(-)